MPPLVVMLPLLEPATPPTKPPCAVIVLRVLSVAIRLFSTLPLLRPTMPPMCAAFAILVAASWLAPTLDAPCTCSVMWLTVQPCTVPLLLPAMPPTVLPTTLMPLPSPMAP